MRGESVWRVATLPVVALVGVVAALALTVDSTRTTAPALHRVAVDRESVRALQAGAQVNDAMLRAIIASWNNEMGHAQDVDAPLALATRVVEAAAELPLWQSELRKVDAKLHEIAKLPSGQRLPALRDAHGIFLTQLPAIERRIDIRSLALRDATSRRLAIEDQFTVLTAKRALAGIDPGPSSPMLQLYVSGIVAGQAAPPASVKELLLDGITSPSLRGQLSRVAAAPELAPLAEELAWSAKATGRPRPLTPEQAATHPSYAALDAARVAAVKGIDATIASALDGLVDGLDRQEQQLESRSQRGRYAIGALGACAVLIFLWLLVRLRSSMNKLRRLAETDSLTSMLNRLGMRRRVEPWFADRGTGAVAVAVLDLDRFKSVNDTYGHEAGDELLRTVSSRLTASTIPDSTAIARWGGDEYVVAFRLDSDITPEVLNGVFERIRRAIATPIDLNGTMIAVSATIGAARCSCGSCDFDDLFRIADHALYVGKFEGRNRVAGVECSFDLGAHLTPAHAVPTSEGQAVNDESAQADA